MVPSYLKSLNCLLYYITVTYCSAIIFSSRFFAKERFLLLETMIHFRYLPSAFLEKVTKKSIGLYLKHPMLLLYSLILELQSNSPVKPTSLSGPLQYLRSCKQIFSLFLQVHTLHPGSNKHKMHVEMCLSSAKTDIL